MSISPASHHIWQTFSQTCPKHPKADQITQTCCRPSFMTPSVEEFQMTMSTARFVFFKLVQNNPGFRQICVFLQFFSLAKFFRIIFPQLDRITPKSFLFYHRCKNFFGRKSFWCLIHFWNPRWPSLSTL